MKDIRTFVQRPPSWLRWSGGILLASVALLFAVVGGMEHAWQLYLGAVRRVIAVPFVRSGIAASCRVAGVDDAESQGWSSYGSDHAGEDQSLIGDLRREQ